MRKTVMTFRILTPLPDILLLTSKKVVTGLQCSVTTVYRASCCGILVWKCGVSSYDLLPR